MSYYPIGAAFLRYLWSQEVLNLINWFCTCPLEQTIGAGSKIRNSYTKILIIWTSLTAGVAEHIIISLDYGYTVASLIWPRRYRAE